MERTYTWELLDGSDPKRRTKIGQPIQSPTSPSDAKAAQALLVQLATLNRVDPATVVLRHPSTRGHIPHVDYIHTP